MTLLEEVAAGSGPRLRELTVGDVDRMVEAGILEEGAPFELIEGMLIQRDRDASGGDGMAHGARHALVVSYLAQLAQRVEPLGCCVRTQLPVVLSGTSAPEPDVAVLRGALRDFAAHHPGPADLVAVIEVADRSLAFDRGTKQRLYARSGLRQYWIVNLVEGLLEVYEEPNPATGRYARRSELRPGMMATLVFGFGPDATLDLPVSAILSP